MKIVIKKITLENFKGIRDMVINFKPDKNIVKGRNKTGKTTIADAIFWCLFGKDSIGRSQFGIKTRENGVEIPRIRHSVTMDLECDGRETTFQRCLVEKWEKVYGSNEMRLRGNLSECYINGNKETARDYQAAVSSIMNEDVFRLLASPTVFTSLPWDEQRRQLMPLAGEITDSEIIQGVMDTYTFHAQDVENALAQIKTEGYDSVRKHLGYKIKVVKNDLDDIPIRMDEVKRTLPDVSPYWGDLEKLQKEAENEIEKVQKGLRTGTYNPRKESLIRKIDFAEKRKINIEQSASNKSLRGKKDIDDGMRELLNQKADLERALKSSRATIELNKTLRDRCKQQLQKCNEEADEVRRLWNENAKRKFQLDESISYCPTCGQTLPHDMIEKNIAELKQVFLDHKANVFKDLTDRANEIKSHIKRIDEQDSKYDVDNTSALEDIDNFVLKIKDVEKLIEEQNEKVPPTVDEILKEDENYQSILKELESLRIELESITAIKEEDANEIKEKLTFLQDRQKALLVEEQNKKKYDDIQSRLDELRKKQETLNKELTELELKADVALAISSAMDDIMESRVNQKFKHVNFRLFKTQVNGERIPYCEAMIDGVPFADLNRAAQINAGLDIINTLSKEHNGYAPVVIDNAEAVNELIPVKSQSICLYVTEDNLTIV